MNHNVESPPVTETSALPRWHATCEADKVSMRKWVNEQLDALDAAFDHDMDELAETQDAPTALGV
jgi:hypothetical protein